MTNFGGLGGSLTTIPLADWKDDLFVMAVERALGAKIRENKGFGADMWSAVANQDWTHTNGDTAGYSFRCAGDFIASIRGEGDYMDWYCSGPCETVSEEIGEAMAKEGWTPDDSDSDAGGVKGG